MEDLEFHLELTKNFLQSGEKHRTLIGINRAQNILLNEKINDTQKNELYTILEELWMTSKSHKLPLFKICAYKLWTTKHKQSWAKINFKEIIERRK